MARIAINDLSVDQQLDEAALERVRGGSQNITNTLSPASRLSLNFTNNLSVGLGGALSQKVQKVADGSV